MSTTDISISKDQGVLALDLIVRASSMLLPVKCMQLLHEKSMALTATKRLAASDIRRGEDFTSGNDVNDFLEHPPTGDESPVWHFSLRSAIFLSH